MCLTLAGIIKNVTTFPRLAIGVLIGTLALCPVAIAQPPTMPITPITLSLDESVTRAEARNPVIASATARVRGASERLTVARKQPNPTLALAHPYGSSSTGGFGEDVILSQLLELPMLIQGRVRSASALREATVNDANITRLDLDLIVQTAYIEALRAEEESILAQKTLDAAQAFTDAANVQFTAGDVPRSNVLRSELELSRVRQSLQTAQTDRDNRYATLRSLLALPTNTPLVLSDKLTYDARTFAIDALTALTLSRRPDVLSARATRNSRKADVSVAKLQAAPNLIVEGRRATTNRVSGGESLRVGIALPIFDYGRIRADVKNAQATVAESDALVQEAERVAKLDVETTSRERELARTVAESFEDGSNGAGRIAKAKEVLEMMQLGYKQGANSYLEVIDAQRTFQSEQVEYLRALAALRNATARLERVTGGKLP